MTYKGTIKNGVVVLPPEVELPEGAEVDVTPREAASGDSLLDVVLQLAKPRDWPDDLASNHDYYLHGQQRKKEPRRARWISTAQPMRELSEQQADDDMKELASMADETIGLPADLSTNHDHYLHGLPKR